MKKRKPGLIVMKADLRYRGMKKIDIKNKDLINYGGRDNSLSSEDFKVQIALCRQNNEEYNKALVTADEKSAKLKSSETKLADMYSRVLLGCISKFGSDAMEVTMLGGTRKSERKRPVRKKKTPA